MVNILVCGGRNFNNYLRLCDVLDRVRMQPRFETPHIINGGAKGADSLASRYAEENLLACTEYPADWEKYGSSAGPIRNAEMLEKEDIDLVIAFPGGAGTAHMVSLAKKKGIDVLLA